MLTCKLDVSSERREISLKDMTKLQKFLLCADGKEILPIEMDQLQNLQDLFIFYDPIVGHFRLSCNLRKLVLYNCGLTTFPSAITTMIELEILGLYFNEFQDQSVSVHELIKLKRHTIVSCNLNAYSEVLEDLIGLDALNLGKNPNLCRQPFSYSKMMNLKELCMGKCGIEIFRMVSKVACV